MAADDEDLPVEYLYFVLAAMAVICLTAGILFLLLLRG
jgi:hypothetical protein